MRDAIIDAFLSIVHGMPPINMADNQFELKLQGFATDILHYIDALLTKPNLDTNDEFVKNIYMLYIDVTEYYGDRIRTQLRQMTGPGILRDGLNHFNFEGMDEIRERFTVCMNRAGCV